MKTNKFKTVSAAAMIAFAAVFATSCDLLNKASETDVAVGDFDFTINTSALAGGGTRAEGNATSFAGSQTITRAQLLSGISAFDYGMIKGVTLEGASVEVKDLTGISIESLTMSCGSLTPVKMNNVSLSEIATTQQESLKKFTSGVIMEVIGKGEATVSLNVTFDRTVSSETVEYVVKLTGITLTAGLNL